MKTVAEQRAERRELVLKLWEEGIDARMIAKRAGYKTHTPVLRIVSKAREERDRRAMLRRPGRRPNP